MASYDQPILMSYPLGDHDYGAGGDALAIQPPAGVSFGRIIDIHGAVKETFTAVTTAAFVRIGTAGDPDKFAELNFGTAADTDGFSTRDDPDAIKDAGKFIDLARDGDSGAALDQLEVALVAPTGGTPAGIASTVVMIGWW